MGKVIRGSAGSSERYTLVVPTFASNLVSDQGELLETAAEDPEPLEPSVDLEAIAAQAQQLVDEAQLHAQALIDDAHQRARAILDEAALAADVIATQTRQAAFDDGYAAGSAQAHGAMSEMIATMGGLLEAARNERHALVTSAEPELVKLAVGIAERVLHQQIALDGGVVIEMAKAAISRLVDREKITVRVNPFDVERMREHRDDLLALGDVKSMRVIEDQRVDRGGVILETDAGSIDAKISTQLSEVRKLLHVVDDVVVITPAETAFDGSVQASSLPATRAS